MTARAPAAEPGEWSERSDAELVVGIRTGDLAALGALFDRYGDSVYDVCAASLGDGPVAARATHRTFVYAAGRAFDLADPEEVGPWVHAVAVVFGAPRRRPWHAPEPAAAVPEPTDLGDGVTVRSVAAAPAHLRDTILWDVEDGAARRVAALGARGVRQYERPAALRSRAVGWIGPVAAGVAVFALVLQAGGDGDPQVSAGPGPAAPPGSTVAAASPGATSSVPATATTATVAGDEDDDDPNDDGDPGDDDRGDEADERDRADDAGPAAAGDPGLVFPPATDVSPPTAGPGGPTPTPTTGAAPPTTARPTPTTRPAATTTVPPPTTTPTTQPPPTTTPTTEPPPPDPPPEPPPEAPLEAPPGG